MIGTKDWNYEYASAHAWFQWLERHSFHEVSHPVIQFNQCIKEAFNLDCVAALDRNRIHLTYQDKRPRKLLRKIIRILARRRKV